MRLTVELLYILAGMILPLYYYPQIKTCLRDQSRLQAYSLRKSANQFALRVAGMPFLIGVVNNHYLTFVVCLDVAGRALELSSAFYSLRSQGVTWPQIRRRLTHRNMRRSVAILAGDLQEIAAFFLRGVRPRSSAEEIAALSARRTSAWAELGDTTILPQYVIEDEHAAQAAQGAQTRPQSTEDTQPGRAGRTDPEFTP